MKKTEEELYNVARYFDYHFEANVETNLTLEKANEKKVEWNNRKARCYVYYDIVKVN